MLDKTLTGSQARAARALIQWPRDHVAKLAGLTVADLAAFETADAPMAAEPRLRLRQALEQGGAVFLPEDKKGGIGVRLKFTAKEARAINRMENEGGPPGTDDV